MKIETKTDKIVKELEKEIINKEKIIGGHTYKVYRVTTKNRSRFENNCFIRLIKYPTGYEIKRIPNSNAEVLNEDKVNIYKNNLEYIDILTKYIRLFKCL